mmetsp:Transcript_3803/g.8392  ORF Transcript_3803/g.8392 Transcript_3803/m.8392 type:complete len:90 (+) Transcript_3803:2557-2826(+)
MTANPSQWMFSDQRSCCEIHYGWSLPTCLAAGVSSSSTSSESATTTVAPGSGKWYINWVTYKCMKDCVGESQCGGLAESWDVLYTTQVR